MKKKTALQIEAKNTMIKLMVECQPWMFVSIYEYD